MKSLGWTILSCWIAVSAALPAVAAPASRVPDLPARAGSMNPDDPPPPQIGYEYVGTHLIEGEWYYVYEEIIGSGWYTIPVDP